MCSYGDNCKIQFKCWFLHPSDIMPTQDELFRDATMGVKFNDVPVTPLIKGDVPNKESLETICEESIVEIEMEKDLEKEIPDLEKEDGLKTEILEEFEKTNDTDMLTLLDEIVDLEDDNDMMDDIDDENDNYNLTSLYESQIFDQNQLIFSLQQQLQQQQFYPQFHIPQFPQDGIY